MANNRFKIHEAKSGRTEKGIDKSVIIVVYLITVLRNVDRTCGQKITMSTG
jgi:hypothetical protein